MASGVCHYLAFSITSNILTDQPHPSSVLTFQPNFNVPPSNSNPSSELPTNMAHGAVYAQMQCGHESNVVYAHPDCSKCVMSRPVFLRNKHSKCPKCTIPPPTAAQRKATQEKVAREKAAREKDAQEKAAQEKAAQEKAAQEMEARHNAWKEARAAKEAVKERQLQENDRRRWEEYQKKKG